jgi:hypothetical protein
MDNLRRTVLRGCVVFAASRGSIAAAPAKPGLVHVDVSGVDSMPKLIEAVNNAARPWGSEVIPDSRLIAECARTFVTNAHAAVEQGYKIPQWVLDRIPARRVAVPVLGMMMFSAYGITFLIPVATVIVATLGSLALMTTAIIAATRELISAV